MTTALLIKCSICGRESLKKGRRTTCSSECSEERNRANSLARYYKNKAKDCEGSVRQCKICGRHFRGYRLRMTCSAGCARENNRRHSKENSLRYRMDGRYSDRLNKIRAELKETASDPEIRKVRALLFLAAVTSHGSVERKNKIKGNLKPSTKMSRAWK